RPCSAAVEWSHPKGSPSNWSGDNATQIIVAICPPDSRVACAARTRFTRSRSATGSGPKVGTQNRLCLHCSSTGPQRRSAEIPLCGPVASPPGETVAPLSMASCGLLYHRSQDKRGKNGHGSHTVFTAHSRTDDPQPSPGEKKSVSNRTAG